MIRAFLAGAPVVLTALGLLVGPPALASLVLHATERRLTLGLTRLFGRRAVLVTGWLGVPVHELSHAAMCVVFRHRIEKLVLFQPDPRTGTLGYVHHSWDNRSPWQVLGTFFIGVAPLIGGSLAILAALHLLLPGALQVPEAALPAGPGDAAGWAALGRALRDSAAHAARAVFSPAQLASWRPWVFLYLALCVGSHISPSRPDLQGSLPGGLVFLALLVVAGAVALAAGTGARLAAAAWTAGLAVGLVLAFVAAINLPLAVLVGLFGRLRAPPGPSRRGSARAVSPGTAPRRRHAAPPAGRPAARRAPADRIRRRRS